MKRKLFFLVTLASLLTVRSASATVSYAYEGIVQGTVAANSTAIVNLYVVETVTGSSTSMIAAAGGLYSAGLNVTLTSGTGASISALNYNSATEPNGFTGNNVKAIYNNIGPVGGTGSSGSLVVITNNNATVPPGPSGTTTGGSVTTVAGTTTTLVFLGSVSIAVGNTASATFTVTSLHDAPATTLDAGSNGNTLTAPDTNYNVADLDSTNNASSPPNPTYYAPYTGANGNGTTFLIQTPQISTPEPSSMLLCGLAVSGMGFGAWRRRKAQQQVESIEAAV